MASQILSGARNVSYTNDTGQNVRLVINHMSDVSQITWAGNTKIITGGRPYAKTLPRLATDSVLGIGVFNRGGAGSKIYIEDGFGDVYINTGTFVTIILRGNPNIPFTAGPVINSSVKSFGGIKQRGDQAGGVQDFSPPVLIFDGGTESVSRYLGEGGGADIRTSIPRTIFLSPGQSFSAICRSYNIVVIKEDGN